MSKNEAANRLLKYSLNILPSAESALLFKVIIRQFSNLLVLMLVAAVIIALILGDGSQAITIGAVVLINALIGTFQEYQAERSVAAFKKLLPHQARVRRNGVIEVISASQIVIGDLVLLSAGDAVPADLRIIKCTGLKANESSLTGENEPKTKFAKPLARADLPFAEMDNMVFSGTHIVRGEAEGAVVAVGKNTVIGGIAGQTTKTKAPLTPLEKQIKRIGIVTGQIALGIAAVIIILSWLGHRGLAETLFLVISLAVAVVPEGLAATVSITLGLGAIKLIKKKVIIKRLPSVETLGGVDVICSDKTGTLTENNLKYSDHILIIDHIRKNVADQLRLTVAAICNNLQKTSSGLIGDPLDLALFRMAESESTKFNKEFTRVGDLPFDARRKRMSVIVQDGDGAYWCLTKGAPLSLLPLLRSKEHTGVIKEKMSEWSRRGDKILLLAYRPVLLKEWLKYQTNPEDFESEIESKLIPLSLVSLADPPRQEVPKAIAESRYAGISTIMVTGDWAPTGVTIGRKIGLYDRDPEIISGTQLEKMTELELANKFKATTDILFSEIDPRQKQKIVIALQHLGHIVAMSGDGVNDAPALKAADIGVAMGKIGTDVAREAADMVLKDDSYTSIVAAVREGRVIFNNIKKFVFYEFGANAAELFAVLLGLVIGVPSALLPIHIIVIDMWIGLFPSLALGVEPPNPHVMGLPPRPKNESLLSRATLWRVLRDGLVVTVGVMAAFIPTLVNSGWSWGQLLTLSNSGYLHALTESFVTISLCQIGLALHARSDKRTLAQLLKTPNITLYFAMLISLAMLLLFVYTPFFNHILHLTPLALKEWEIPIVTLIALTFVEDLSKKYLLHFKGM